MDGYINDNRLAVFAASLQSTEEVNIVSVLLLLRQYALNLSRLHCYSNSLNCSEVTNDGLTLFKLAYVQASYIELKEVMSSKEWQIYVGLQRYGLIS